MEIKGLKESLILLAFSCLMFSCTKDNFESIGVDQHYVDSYNEITEILSSKYGIETEVLNKDRFAFKHQNETYIAVKSSADKVVLSGPRLNNEFIEFPKLTKEGGLVYPSALALV